MTQKFKVINPYTNKVFTTYDFESPGSVEEKINLLKIGRTNQRNLKPSQRAEILSNLADLLKENTEKFVELLVNEIGKTIQDARVEILRSISTIKISANEVSNIHGELIGTDNFGLDHQKKALIEWQPVGTVLAITPFNFPLNLALHKIAPAFAAGNTILFKPHEQNFQSGKLLVEMCHRAGMSNDVIQFAMPSVESMSGVISHPNISLVSLTGGTKTAEAVAKSISVKKYLCELGGNDPLIVFEDGDIEKAVKATINQRFATAGQRCTAAKRVFLHSKIYDTFKERLIDETCKLNVGDPTLDDTFVGPLVNKAAADDVMNKIRNAIDLGATVLCGNERTGNVIYPTILENVNEEANLIKHETFGPVVPLMRFTDLDQLISQINQSSYGLQAGVFTHDMRLINRLYRELEVGTLIVGDGPGFRAEHLPFGGIKHSGIGSEGIKYAIREMSVRKTLIL